MGVELLITGDYIVEGAQNISFFYYIISGWSLRVAFFQNFKVSRARKIN